MSISLEKGNKISLEKEAPSITKFYVALGWAEQKGVDPDVSALLCKNDASGEPYLYPFANGDDDSERKYGNLVFFNNTKSHDNAVVHSGDNRDGHDRAEVAGTAAADDDEAIYIDFAKLDPEVDEISIILTIDKAKELGLTFKNVRDCFLRICENDENGREIAHYKPAEDFAAFTAAQVGSLVRTNGKWSFVAVGQGYVATFSDMVGQYVH